MTNRDISFSVRMNGASQVKSELQQLEQSFSRVASTYQETIRRIQSMSKGNFHIPGITTGSVGYSTGQGSMPGPVHSLYASGRSSDIARDVGPALNMAMMNAFRNAGRAMSEEMQRGLNRGVVGRTSPWPPPYASATSAMAAQSPELRLILRELQKANQLHSYKGDNSTPLLPRAPQRERFPGGEAGALEFERAQAAYQSKQARYDAYQAQRVQFDAASRYGMATGNLTGGGHFIDPADRQLIQRVADSQRELAKAYEDGLARAASGGLTGASAEAHAFQARHRVAQAQGHALQQYGHYKDDMLMPDDLAFAMAQQDKQNFLTQRAQQDYRNAMMNSSSPFKRAFYRTTGGRGLADFAVNRFMNTGAHATAALGIYGAWNLLDHGVRESVQLQRAQSGLDQIVQNPYQRARLTSSLYGSASQYGVNPTEAFKLGYQMYGVYGNAPAASLATNAALLLSKTSQIELPEASQDLIAISDAYSGYGKKGGGAAGMMNTVQGLVNLQNKYGVNVEQTLQGSARMAELFSDYKVDKNTGLAWTGLIQRETGASGVQVASKIERVLPLFSDPKAQQALALIGQKYGAFDYSKFLSGDVNAQDVVESLQSKFSGILKNGTADQKKMVNTDILRISRALGGERNMSFLMPLFTKGDTIAGMKNALNNPGNAASERWAHLSSTVDEQLNKMRTNFVELVQAFASSGLLQGFTAILEVVNPVVHGLSAVSHGFDTLTSALGPLGTAVKALLAGSLVYAGGKKVWGAYQGLTGKAGIVMGRLGLAGTAEDAAIAGMPLSAQAAASSVVATEGVGMLKAFTTGLSYGNAGLKSLVSQLGVAVTALRRWASELLVSGMGGIGKGLRLSGESGLLAKAGTAIRGKYASALLARGLAGSAEEASAMAGAAGAGELGAFAVGGVALPIAVAGGLIYGGVKIAQAIGQDHAADKSYRADLPQLQSDFLSATAQGGATGISNAAGAMAARAAQNYSDHSWLYHMTHDKGATKTATKLSDINFRGLNNDDKLRLLKGAGVDIGLLQKDQQAAMLKSLTFDSNGHLTGGNYTRTLVTPGGGTMDVQGFIDPNASLNQSSMQWYSKRMAQKAADDMKSAYAKRQASGMNLLPPEYMAFREGDMQASYQFGNSTINLAGNATDPNGPIGVSQGKSVSYGAYIKQLSSDITSTQAEINDALKSNNDDMVKSLTETRNQLQQQLAEANEATAQATAAYQGFWMDASGAANALVAADKQWFRDHPNDRTSADAQQQMLKYAQDQATAVSAQYDTGIKATETIIGAVTMPANKLGFLKGLVTQQTARAQALRAFFGNDKNPQVQDAMGQAISAQSQYNQAISQNNMERIQGYYSLQASTSADPVWKAKQAYEEAIAKRDETAREVKADKALANGTTGDPALDSFIKSFIDAANQGNTKLDNAGDKLTQAAQALTAAAGALMGAVNPSGGGATDPTAGVANGGTTSAAGGAVLNHRTTLEQMQLNALTQHRHRVVNRAGKVSYNYDDGWSANGPTGGWHQYWIDQNRLFKNVGGDMLPVTDSHGNQRYKPGWSAKGPEGGWANWEASLGGTTNGGKTVNSSLMSLLKKAGFSGSGLSMAYAIVMAESGGNASETNTKGNVHGVDRGLFQINSYWHPEVTDAQAFDPLQNAIAAYQISSGGTNWSQWATYNNGAYKQYLGQSSAMVTGGGGGNGLPSGSTSDILAFAEQQIGKPYVWGAEGPNAFDCSGLIQYVYNKYGIKLPRTTAQQIKAGLAVHGLSDAQIGDLIFMNHGNHVGMYAGNGMMVVAPHTGAKVQLEKVPTTGITAIRRVINDGSYIAPTGNTSGNGQLDSANADVNNQAYAYQQAMDAQYAAYQSYKAGPVSQISQINATIASLTEKIKTDKTFGDLSAFYADETALSKAIYDKAMEQITAAEATEHLNWDTSNAVQMLQSKVNTLNRQMAAYLKNGGKKTDSQYIQMRSDLQDALRDKALQATQYALADEDYYFQMHQKSFAQHIQSLIALRNGINTKSRAGLELWRQINEEIQGLIDGLAQTFNIPTNIKLPTLYEVRRSLAVDAVSSGTHSGGAMTNPILVPIGTSPYPPVPGGVNPNPTNSAHVAAAATTAATTAATHVAMRAALMAGGSSALASHLVLGSGGQSFPIGFGHPMTNAAFSDPAYNQILLSLNWGTIGAQERAGIYKQSNKLSADQHRKTSDLRKLATVEARRKYLIAHNHGHRYDKAIRDLSKTISSDQHQINVDNKSIAGDAGLLHALEHKYNIDNKSAHSLNGWQTHLAGMMKHPASGFRPLHGVTALLHAMAATPGTLKTPSAVVNQATSNTVIVNARSADAKEVARIVARALGASTKSVTTRNGSSSRMY